jgi:hypothetical protein
MVDPVKLLADGFEEGLCLLRGNGLSQHNIIGIIGSTPPQLLQFKAILS